MDEKINSKNNLKKRINLFEKKETKPLSLDLHTMPKAEDRKFSKWITLSFLIFVLIILIILFFI